MLKARQQAAEHVPKWLVVVAVAVTVVGVVITLLGAFQIGTTWDERTNMRSLQVFFDQGWNITEDALIDGQPDPNYLWGVYVYGPVSLLFTHAVSVLAGAEEWAQVQYTAQAYAIRHVAGAFIGLLGIGAVGVTIRVITKSWRWGILGTATLASVPLWTGNSMMNIKDGPVATGYALATLGIVLLMRDDYLSSRKVRVWALFGVLAGAFLAAGTRAAAGVPIAGSVVGAGLVWWLVRRQPQATNPLHGGNTSKSAIRLASRRVIEGGLALVGAYLALVALYPNVWKNPFTLFYQGVVVSAKFPFDEPIMFAGSWVGQPVPWEYLPAWFAAQLPLLVVIASTVFFITWAWQAFNAAIHRHTFVGSGAIIESTPVVLQALMLPMVAIALQATVYNGVRQFLFVVPAAASASVLGMWIVTTKVPRIREAGAWRSIALLTIAVGLVTPTVMQVFLYPYTYSFYNAAASLRSIDGNWPTDYWRASSNELMRRLPADGPESCAYEQGRNSQRMPCSDQPMFKPYLDQRGTSALPGSLAPNQYWLVRENQGLTATPDGCTPHDAITRRLFWQTITIAQIFRCDASASIRANGESTR